MCLVFESGKIIPLIFILYKDNRSKDYCIPRNETTFLEIHNSIAIDYGAVLSAQDVPVKAKIVLSFLPN
jgi:hypothetical protein